MKKTLLILLALMLVFSFVSCSDDEDKSEEKLPLLGSTWLENAEPEWGYKISLENVDASAKYLIVLKFSEDGTTYDEIPHIVDFTVYNSGTYVEITNSLSTEELEAYLAEYIEAYSIYKTTLTFDITSLSNDIISATYTNTDFDVNIERNYKYSIEGNILSLIPFDAGDEPNPIYTQTYTFVK